MQKIDHKFHNKSVHDKLHRIYNLKHVEIYNDFEQTRLINALSELVSLSNSKNPTVLDVGAGTGNLSLKLLNLGANVNALDVSPKSLALLKSLSNNNPHLTLTVSSEDILPFRDNTFDITCTYSVLHHVPDYLHLISEMVRVTKIGGVIYIDHEANSNKYHPPKPLQEYYDLTKQTRMEHFKKLFKTKELFTMGFIKGAFIKIFINRRYQREGDIHVWPDDHIEWDKVKNLFKSSYCEPLVEESYLLFRPKAGVETYKAYSSRCNDMTRVIFRKYK